MSRRRKYLRTFIQNRYVPLSCDMEKKQRVHSPVGNRSWSLLRLLHNLKECSYFIWTFIYSGLRSKSFVLSIIVCITKYNTQMVKYQEFNDTWKKCIPLKIHSFVKFKNSPIQDTYNRLYFRTLSSSSRVFVFVSFFRCIAYFHQKRKRLETYLND